MSKHNNIYSIICGIQILLAPKKANSGLLNIVAFVVVTISTTLHAQVDEHAIDTIYKNNILPSPSFTYTPETDIVVGAFALYQFKTKKTDFGTRPSHLILYGAVSMQKQYTVRFEHNVFISPLDNWYFKGLTEYKRWPEQYFGIGPNTSLDSLKISDYQMLTIDQKVYKNLGNKLFIGLQFRYINTYDVKFYDTDENELPPPDVVGNQGGPYVGFGIGLLKDLRNSILTPTEKYYFEFSLFYYSNSIGSTTEFLSLLLDYRKYWDLTNDKRNVIAIQGKAFLTSGEVPFLELARLGGKQIMRGFLEGRYRDKQYFQVQAEYRKHIIGRFGAAVFAGLGNVMPKVNEFDPSYIKAAVGMGLRFNINRKDPTNVRIDVAYGFEKEANGLYITFGEAF